MKYSWIIVLVVLTSCNHLHRPHWLHWPSGKDTLKVDPFYTDHGDWDDTRIPLLKPYEAIKLNGQKEWMMNFHGTTTGQGMCNVQEVGIIDSLIILHSDSAHMFFDGKAVDKTWFVVRPKDSLEMGFTRKEDFEKYLFAN